MRLSPGFAVAAAIILGLALSGCRTARRKSRCESWYEKAHWRTWDARREAWTRECGEIAKGRDPFDLQDVLIHFQAGFMSRCDDHFSPAVKTGKLSMKDIGFKCVRGRPGADALESLTGLPPLPRPKPPAPPQEEPLPNAFLDANRKAGTVSPADWPKLDPPFDRFAVLISSYAEPADARDALVTMVRHTSKLRIGHELPEYGWAERGEGGSVVSISLGEATDSAGDRHRLTVPVSSAGPLAVRHPTHPRRERINATIRQLRREISSKRITELRKRRELRRLAESDRSARSNPWLSIPWFPTDPSSRPE